MAIDPAHAISTSINVAKLDVDTFERVEADESKTIEAGAVVVVSTVLGAVGSIFVIGVWGFIAYILIGLIGWGVWSWLSAIIAEKVFGVQTTDLGEMLRTTGYAHAPRALGVIPFLGWVGAIWSLVAVIVGMRQAGEMTTTQAVVAALIGFIPYVIATGIVTAILL